MGTGKKLKLYGERNTGTRYLTQLLEHNLSSDVIRGVVPRWATWIQSLSPGKEGFRDTYFKRTFAHNLGWKHSQVPVDRLLGLDDRIGDVHFVALVKNPYSWLLSLGKRPYHQRQGLTVDSMGIETLLKSEWPTVGRENGPKAYRDAIDLWNCKVGSYLELANRLPTTILTYEALVADPAAELDKLRRATGSNWTQGRFENLAESTKEKDKDSAYYLDYYGNERWRSKLSDEAIALINTRLSHTLMTEFGYRLLSVEVSR